MIRVKLPHCNSTQRFLLAIRGGLISILEVLNEEYHVISTPANILALDSHPNGDEMLSLSDVGRSCCFEPISGRIVSFVGNVLPPDEERTVTCCCR